MGANFAGDHGNIMVHIGYSDDKGLLSRERKNTRVDDLSQFTSTLWPVPNYSVEHEPYFSSFPPQGRFDVNGTSNPIDDFTFSPAGVLQPCFSANFDCNGPGSGPNGFNRQFFRTLSTPVRRWLIAESGHFDIAPDIGFFTELTYAKTRAKTEIEPLPSIPAARTRCFLVPPRAGMTFS